MNLGTNNNKKTDLRLTARTCKNYIKLQRTKKSS